MLVFTYMVLCLANNNITSRATEAIASRKVRHHRRHLRTIATALRKLLSS